MVKLRFCYRHLTTYLIIFFYYAFKITTIPSTTSNEDIEWQLHAFNNVVSSLKSRTAILITAREKDPRVLIGTYRIPVNLHRLRLLLQQPGASSADWYRSTNGQVDFQSPACYRQLDLTQAITDEAIAQPVVRRRHNIKRDIQIPPEQGLGSERHWIPPIPFRASSKAYPVIWSPLKTTTEVGEWSCGQLKRYRECSRVGVNFWFSS